MNPFGYENTASVEQQYHPTSASRNAYARILCAMYEKPLRDSRHRPSPFLKGVLRSHARMHLLLVRSWRLARGDVFFPCGVSYPLHELIEQEQPIVCFAGTEGFWTKSSGGLRSQKTFNFRSSVLSNVCAKSTVKAKGDHVDECICRPKLPCLKKCRFDAYFKTTRRRAFPETASGNKQASTFLDV